MSDGARGPQRPVWETQQRLDLVANRLGELAKQLGDVSQELVRAVRATDANSFNIRRLDERLSETTAEINDVLRRLERLAPIDWCQRIDAKLGTITDDATSPFVRKSEFTPVKTAVFSLIGALCLAVLGAVINLVVR